MSLFREMEIIDELAAEYYANPTKENFKHYQKMQNLFFKHVKQKRNDITANFRDNLHLWNTTPHRATDNER